MSDYQVLEQEITALDCLINRQLELINGLKEMLRKEARGPNHEMELLRELSHEITLVRELREARLMKDACLRELEINQVLIESEYVNQIGSSG